MKQKSVRVAGVALLCVALLLGLCMFATAASPLELDLADGTVTIGDGTVTQGSGAPQAIPEDGLVLTGTSSTNTIVVNPGAGKEADFAIRDLHLTTTSSSSLIDIQSGSVVITLAGENTLRNEAGGEKAVVHVSSASSLTMDGSGQLEIDNGLEDGVHEANGAAIGGNFQEAPNAITINSGEITVKQYGTSAGIGGGARADSGKISITGGTIQVTVLPAGGQLECAGTGIGGGGENVKDNGSIGSGGSADISITGGSVTAHVESNSFYFGYVSSGAAIGAGENKGGTIYIGGDAVVNASATNAACAIGSSNAAYTQVGSTVIPAPDDPMDITIEGNAQVFAQTTSLDYYGQGAYAGAAIGMSVQNLQPCTITIGGSANVTARGSWYGAGIGGSYVQVNNHAQPMTITIQDSAVVDASAYVYGAGIGSGYGNSGAESATIIIKDNPTVVAKGGWGGAGIGGGKGTQGGSITITGGDITAIGGVGGVDLFGVSVGGAGIGAGAVGDTYGYGALAGSIYIGGDANVKAYGSDGSAGIGGGNLNGLTTTGDLTPAQNTPNGGGAKSIEIAGSAQVLAVGGSGASAIGAGADYGDYHAMTEELTIHPGTTITAYADGAKFAIDVANPTALSALDTVLNGRFAEGELKAGQENPIALTKDNHTDSDLTLPAGYRAFAVTASDGAGIIRVQEGGSQRLAYYQDGADAPISVTYPLYEDAGGGYAMVTKDELRWIDTITITPVDITVYMGGDGGYDAVVGDTGITSSNSLPHPLFRVEAPAGADPEALVFTNNGNTWTLIPTGNGYYHFSEDGDAKVRVTYSYLDENNVEHTITDDAFDPTEIEDVYTTFTIRLYAGEDGVSQVSISDGSSSYRLEAGTGTLTVRAVAQEDTVSPVLSAAPASPVAAGSGVLVAAPGTTYTLNNLGVPLPADAAPSLLFDDILDDASHDRTAALVEAIAGQFDVTIQDGCYQAQYLDLVDANNGNAWITASGDVTVYWGYPEGTDEDSTFTLYHFTGLHRDGSGSGFDLSDIAKSEIAVVEDIEKTANGIAFAVKPGGFSPYVLVWEKRSPSIPILPTVPEDTTPGLLNTLDHIAYIQGYPDGTVRPEANITRAEVATIFYRLLTDDARAYYKSTDSGFSDVNPGDWYNTSIATMVQAGILTGYSDGTFRPDANITRAEFATIAARFLSNPYSLGVQFYDTEGHWAEVYINRAAEVGWINGYPDGSFKPEKYITRAEAVTLVNHVLGRKPHKDHFLPNMVIWPDNPETAWYYEDIQEATNSHNYDWAPDKAYEIWTSLKER